MRYVLDASVALKWVLNEPQSDKARRLRDDFQRRVHELLAPTTFIVEIGHALTRAERKGIIKPPMIACMWGLPSASGANWSRPISAFLYCSR